MLEHKELRREGDTNFGKARQSWWQQLGEKSKMIVERDEKVFVRQSMSTPCMNDIVDAKGCYIQDGSGKRYLDFHGNSVHQVGYKNPKVIEAIKNQMDTLPFIPRRFTADVAVEAARALIDQTTSKDYKVLFTPSGSAAVGLALKIARKVTGKYKVISHWEAFHGAGLDTISVGGEYVFKKDIGPLMPGCIKAIPYNGYRNLIHSNNPEEVADFCLRYIEYIIENEGEIGAILLEPIRATDIHIPPESYFKKLRALCDKHQILLIFDEIPTALGRSGKFYVHQHFDIEPDILVLGKGLGGGIVPQAAVLVKTALDQAEEVSLGHYTHEKSAIGCAAIVATVKYIEEQGLLAHTREMENYIEARGEALFAQYECIGEVRQIGLLVAFECVKDRATKEKDEELTEKILYSCLRRGLSFKVAGGSCITWHPPLIVTKEQLGEAFDILEAAIKEIDL